MYYKKICHDCKTVFACGGKSCKYAGSKRYIESIHTCHCPTCSIDYKNRESLNSSALRHIKQCPKTLDTKILVAMEL